MEEVDNEKDCKRTKDRSPSPAVKSKAVVKYTAFQSPVGYSRLQCNTDLNLPPSNYGVAVDSYGLKQILTESSGLSSFRMAHMFPDAVGEVDVISGAECIKKLLKLPYQPNGTVSMMVHRVEKTLLLDDFDVYNYLMKSEWSWLKNFFYENILKTMSEQERMALTLSSTPQSLQLTHKFLSHSVSTPPLMAPRPVQPICLPGPSLPEPEVRSEEPINEHLFNRNVHWTFEDIHMLIGSDLPIFGDQDRPCVSLKLRDAREPINVLTGIDYWLDNLMCNVPEVLMCYHLDGIVQKYEPMKTEDLPNLENSRFSPKVIRNVAQNILSFLKSNVTKEGHTYWLFKGPHDDVVKLYDLTSLCPDRVDNPFTTPVAMLLYRVARNMRLTNRSGHVRSLLTRALRLLEPTRHPHIAASARYMLADVFLPADTDPACPHFTDESSDSDGDDLDLSDLCEQDSYTTSKTDYNTAKGSKTEDTKSDDKNKSDNAKAKEKSEKDDVKTEKKSETGDNKAESEREESSENALALQVRGLALSNIGDRKKDNKSEDKNASERVPLGTSCPERCGRALSHALRGVRALRHVTRDRAREEERERLKQQIINEEQHPKMANPYEPIKMDYEPLNKKKDKTQNKDHASRSRRRKRDRKYSEKTDKTGNYIVESTPKVDKNAILIHKEKNVIPSWNEPDRDDSFAWKLHLKTLLYEKICLAYTTLAEYSYAHEQYGFSLKYIAMASKCQKLLSNMIIKSRIVDASCLLGRVGDSYFQLSKRWASVDQFKKQFETDHEVDSSLRLEIDSDLVEEVEGVASDQFDMELTLPTSEEASMQLSCDYYRRALTLASAPRRAELLRRLASVCNEMAVKQMHRAQQIFVKYVELDDPKTQEANALLAEFNELSIASRSNLDTAADMFEEVQDVPNLALLLCNKGRYMRFRMHCDVEGLSSQEKRIYYKEAETLYTSALTLIGKTSPSVRELVSWELSCHSYTRAALMHDDPQQADANEVAEALKHALKHCVLSSGPRLYLYQFRAAMLHRRLGSLYHSQYRLTQEEGPKRRTLFQATKNNYEQALNLVALLEDTPVYLTVLMEYVALLETHANVSPNLKLKSLQNAIQLMRQSQSMMAVIRDKDPDDQKETTKLDETDETGKNEHTVLVLFENRLHCILKNIIQYCRSKSNKDYEKMTDMYKKLYSASLRIKKSDDLKLYAGSICEVLEAMAVISKEFE